MEQKQDKVLKLIRSTGIKLSLPISVILDGVIYARLLIQDMREQEGKPISNVTMSETSEPLLEVLIATTLYLSSKVNEVEGRVRTRDFLNVAIFAIKEEYYITQSLAESSLKEHEDGVFLKNGKISIDYSKNQFKFMPTSQELNLLNVKLLYNDS